MMQLYLMLNRDTVQAGILPQIHTCAIMMISSVSYSHSKWKDLVEEQFPIKTSSTPEDL